jgi:hypothetical protein
MIFFDFRISLHRLLVGTQAMAEKLLVRTQATVELLNLPTPNY